MKNQHTLANYNDKNILDKMMPSYNKDMQLQKTAELYAYVLSEQDKEIPEEVVESLISPEYPVDCIMQLVQEIEAMSADMFEKLVYDPNQTLSRDLESWWEMYKEADKLRHVLFRDVEA